MAGGGVFFDVDLEEICEGGRELVPWDEDGVGVCDKCDTVG